MQFQVTVSCPSTQWVLNCISQQVKSDGSRTKTLTFDMPAGSTGQLNLAYASGSIEVFWGRRSPYGAEPNVFITPQEGDRYIVAAPIFTLLRPPATTAAVDAPSTTAAGQPFDLGVVAKNDSGGTAKYKLLVNGAQTQFSLGPGKSDDLVQSLAMPFDDLTATVSLQALPDVFKTQEPAGTAPNGDYIYREGNTLTYNNYWTSAGLSNTYATFYTDTRTILAGFPDPSVAGLTPPGTATPGSAFDLAIPVTNNGYAGTVGVKVSMPGFEQTLTQFADAGQTVNLSLSPQMPVAQAVTISVTPLYVGRGQQTVKGTPQTFQIKAVNYLFQDANMATMNGGGPITGFVAGKNVQVSGISSTAGTGGPPLFPYGGYFLSGTISGEAVITYDELDYLKYVTTNDIATARAGTLISRLTTSYTYSKVPLPSMALDSVRATTALFTLPRPGATKKFPGVTDVLGALRVGLP